jgi:hypothetical protein
LASLIGLHQPITRLRIARAYQSNRHNYEREYQVVVDKEALSVNLPDWKGSLGWSRIEQVYEYAEGFLVIYNRSEYLAIPKRAFGNDSTADQFKRLVAQLIDEEVSQLK